jgi:hypothetical protein
MGAKAHDVDLSHSGRKIARKPGESKRGRAFGLARLSEVEETAIKVLE